MEATTTATAKVRRVLPRPLAERVDAVLDAVELTSDSRADPPRPQALVPLAEAVRDHRRIVIDYTDHAGNRTRPTIDPYDIVAHNGRWYVVGADSATGAPRNLRADRIRRVVAQADTFEPPPDLDSRQRLLDALARAPYRHRVSVVVAGPPETTLADLRHRLPASVAVLSPCDAGVRIRIRAERLDWVPGLLVGLDRPFVVEEPEELKMLLRTVSRRLSAAAG